MAPPRLATAAQQSTDMDAVRCPSHAATNTRQRYGRMAAGGWLAWKPFGHARPPLNWRRILEVVEMEEYLDIFGSAGISLGEAGQNTKPSARDDQLGQGSPTKRREAATRHLVRHPDRNEGPATGRYGGGVRSEVAVGNAGGGEPLPAAVPRAMFMNRNTDDVDQQAKHSCGAPRPSRVFSPTPQSPPTTPPQQDPQPGQQHRGGPPPYAFARERRQVSRLFEIYLGNAYGQRTASQTGVPQAGHQRWQDRQQYLYEQQLLQHFRRELHHHQQHEVRHQYAQQQQGYYNVQHPQHPQNAPHPQHLQYPHQYPQHAQHPPHPLHPQHPQHPQYPQHLQHPQHLEHPQRHFHHQHPQYVQHHQHQQRRQRRQYHHRVHSLASSTAIPEDASVPQAHFATPLRQVPVPPSKLPVYRED